MRQVFTTYLYGKEHVIVKAVWKGWCKLWGNDTSEDFRGTIEIFYSLVM